jgi:ribonuclease HI
MVLLLDWNMSQDSLVFVGFANGASHHTQNLSSTAWVIYSLLSQLVVFRGACLIPSTNNVAKYRVVIELLCDSITHGIQSLEVRLDAQLVVP